MAHQWISEYVDGDPKNSTEAHQVPAAVGRRQDHIVPNEENPGYYAATFDLRPHFQLEGMDIGLRLVSRLPVAQIKSVQIVSSHGARRFKCASS